MLRSALITAAALTVLAGCGKKDEPVMPKDSATGATAGQASESAGKSAEEINKLLASLPAPYNAGDVENGKRKAGLCRSCHSFNKDGPDMTGPNLYGVIGRKAASRSGYRYSDALKQSGLTLDPATVDRWLENPRTFVPGNKMTFAGLKEAQDRIDVIAYLRTQADS